MSRTKAEAAAQMVETQRENSEILHGDLICKERSQKLLEELSFPKGLLLLKEIEEMGYNKTTGFLWLKQKKKQQHKFNAIGSTVVYDTLITAFTEERRMKKMTGVKSKELLVVVTVSDIYIEDPSSGTITFATPAGLSSTFPVSAFDLEDEQAEEKKMEN